MGAPDIRRTGPVLAFLLMGAAPAQPVEIPAFFTVGQLYDICSSPNAGWCSMYVAGVLDGLFYADVRSGDPRLCRSRINNREAAEITMQWIEDNNQFQNMAAALAVREALRERFRC